MTIKPRHVIPGRTVRVGGLDQAYVPGSVGSWNSGPQSFCNQPVIGGSAAADDPDDPDRHDAGRRNARRGQRCDH